MRSLPSDHDHGFLVAHHQGAHALGKGQEPGPVEVHEAVPGHEPHLWPDGHGAEVAGSSLDDRRHRLRIGVREHLPGHVHDDVAVAVDHEHAVRRLVGLDEPEAPHPARGGEAALSGEVGDQFGGRQGAAGDRPRSEADGSGHGHPQGAAVALVGAAHVERAGCRAGGQRLGLSERHEPFGVGGGRRGDGLLSFDADERERVAHRADDRGVLGDHDLEPHAGGDGSPEPPGASADGDEDREGGVVQSALKPRCIGCSNCVIACPFGVPKYMADTDQMMKRDMCTDRTSEGLKPTRASVRPSEAPW
ncbi:MAG: hypothetical protein KDA94_14400, partial [Acidimicrobiales bacterium]|nr:hypothetical protein [Acidimicrobiales bacterium]